MNEPFVNHALMQRVLDIKARGEDNSKIILETVNITDTWNKAIHMTEEELIVCTLAALYVCPRMVFAAIAEDREELLRKGNSNGRIKNES